MAYYDNILELEPDRNGSNLRIGIVMSRFNINIGEGLLGACTAELKMRGVLDSNIMLVTVPGALEAPMALQKMALSDQFDALIALGAVVRGDTYHFEVVSNESARGLMKVQIETEIPIANGILTTENDDQAIARMSQKGIEAAQAAVEMANLQIIFDEISE
ncbi:MAG: 6,7-dimethyl-8-ribityllumazine synthase [Betaproteobacteria bacterium]|nr:6,7-dimethyl-8-ribityllumazine synthase [Betaproteobacteria bacterium]